MAGIAHTNTGTQHSRSIATDISPTDMPHDCHATDSWDLDDDAMRRIATVSSGPCQNIRFAKVETDVYVSKCVCVCLVVFVCRVIHGTLLMHTHTISQGTKEFPIQGRVYFEPPDIMFEAE